MIVAMAQGQARLLAGLDETAGPLSLARHQYVHGPLPLFDRRSASSAALLSAVEAVGLRGRGGGGYPTARKLNTVARRRGPTVLVVNGAESEPASGKDALLLSRTPHLVLDGAAIAADVIGADDVVLWLHTGSATTGAAAYALREREGLDRVPARIELAPSGYLAGESSAVVSYLSGGPALPTMSPPHATEHGVDGRPTVVSNVETLAQLALLARHGPHWYRTAGTQAEPGTMLVTVTGAVRRPAVIEVPVGTPLGDAVSCAEPIGWPGAVLVGGYAGSWLPWDYAAAHPLSRRGLALAGATLGVGLLAVLPEDRCGLAETRWIVRWLAGETAGQCGPCLNGLPAIADAFDQLVARTAVPETVARLQRWAGMVTGRGLCHHPDGVAMTVRSALRTFDRQVRWHLTGAHCPGHRLPPLLPLPPQAPPGEQRRGGEFQRGGEHRR